MSRWSPRHRTTPISATDSQSASDGAAALAQLVRKAAHETRNRLNGLAVNVEVVRSRLAKEASEKAAPVAAFATLAASETEQLAAMTEGLIALLQVTIASVDDRGVFRCSVSGTGAITLEATRQTIERAIPRLEQLSRVVGFRVESTDTAVILTFPAKPLEA